MAYTRWTLLGTAEAQDITPGKGFTRSLLRLAPPGLGDQAGAAFAPTALAPDFNQPFRFDFDCYIPVLANPGLRGDRLTFTLSTAPGLGQGGSSLGYAGLPTQSLAFAIDTVHFSGGPESPKPAVWAASACRRRWTSQHRDWRAPVSTAASPPAKARPATAMPRPEACRCPSRSAVP